MQFITGETSYSVARLYDLFQHKLPIVVMVTQGFCGDIVEDTFDREQIMILCAVSRQNRVVGYFNIGSKTRLMSIPEDYMEKLCIVRNRTVAKEDRLYEILRSNNLPIVVQFPQDRVLSMSNKSINTNHIPPIELTKRFEEVYLLGNTLIDGELSEKVIRVPLYLSELRFSVVLGIKGHSSEQWRLYLDHLKRKCSGFEYDMHFGNPNIAEYDPTAIHSDTKIAYIQPRSYSSLIGLVRGQSIRTRQSLHVPSREGYKRQELAQEINRPLPPVPSQFRQSLYRKPGDTNMPYITESADNMYLTPVSRPRSNVVDKAALVTRPGRTSQIPTNDARRPMTAFETRPPTPEPGQFEPRIRSDIPMQQSIQEYPIISKQYYIKNLKYTNDLPRSVVSPMVHSKQPQTREVQPHTREEQPHTREGQQHMRVGQQHTREGQQHTREEQPHTREERPYTREGQPQTREGQQHARGGQSHTREGQPQTRQGQSHMREGLRTSQSGEANRLDDNGRKSISVTNVERLSIGEVGKYLKILKLDQYSEMFRDNMIDGTILVSLTGSMLRNELRMTGVEALRLLKFAQEGYIPA